MKDFVNFVKLMKMEIIAITLAICFIIVLVSFMVKSIDKFGAKQKQEQVEITEKLNRMGYRDRDNVEVYLKGTKWYMRDFLRSKTVREKYKEWTR